MSDAWTWTYEDATGKPVRGAATVSSQFPTQGDAESWLGEQWRELTGAGVAAVTLHEAGAVVYGPMSLSDGS
ncbi:hypothetical protein [Leekyejoonella antrihumi]|uniref:DUF2188 domain-containing protein n=1 Tax=Leekyejoonella antrihumi TaxID=1660198 RepID=A0A563E565_9MICO|nr:hypothetical protein [Leekyejoonella antrihumi]TWP37014.1 hypothetical protein FGL98_08145 [Leekyejoonella antrihumi]